MQSDDDNLDIPKPVPKTFHEEAAELFQRVSQTLLNTHPEVRSVVSIFDYDGDLNNAKITNAVWVGRGPNGLVDSPEAIIGSAYQTLKLLGAILERSRMTLQAREWQILDVSKRLLELETKIAAQTKTQSTTDRLETGAAG